MTQKIDAKDMTLNQVLTLLGYETKNARHSRKAVYKDGEQLGCFSAHECWQWLQRMHPELEIPLPSRRRTIEIDAQTIEDLRTVIEHYSEDEENDFTGTPLPERANHIYIALRELRRFLEKLSFDATC